jgi:hypothetical protein
MTRRIFLTSFLSFKQLDLPYRKFYVALDYTKECNPRETFGRTPLEALNQIGVKVWTETEYKEYRERINCPK